MLTTNDLNEILLKASKATQGEWDSTMHHSTVVVEFTQTHGKYISFPYNDQEDFENAHFIASANPTVVQEIITRLIEAEKVIDWYSGNFNGKDGSRWNGDIFFIETKVGSTESAQGSKYAEGYKTKHMKDET